MWTAPLALNNHTCAQATTSNFAELINKGAVKRSSHYSTDSASLRRICYADLEAITWLTTLRPRRSSVSTTRPTFS